MEWLPHRVTITIIYLEDREPRDFTLLSLISPPWISENIYYTCIITEVVYTTLWEAAPGLCPPPGKLVLFLPLCSLAPYHESTMDCILGYFDSLFFSFLRNLLLTQNETEAVTMEYNFLLVEVVTALDNLQSWVAPKPQPKDLLHKFDTVFIQAEPLGVMLNISAWNFPIQLTLSPLIGAIAAGEIV